MKRIFSLLIALLAVSASLLAQNADIRRAAEQNKKHTTAQAAVTQTRHNASVAKDVVSKGTLYYQKGSGLSMVFAADKEQLIATPSDDFTMVRSGRQRTVKATYNALNPYKVLTELFMNVLTGTDDTALRSVANVKYAKQGQKCTVTATPKTTNAKQTKRAMYTSLEATINLKTGQIERIRISERAGGYLQYDFSGYTPGAKVPADVFQPKFTKKK